MGKTHLDSAVPRIGRYLRDTLNESPKKWKIGFFPEELAKVGEVEVSGLGAVLGKYPKMFRLNNKTGTYLPKYKEFGGIKLFSDNLSELIQIHEGNATPKERISGSPSRVPEAGFGDGRRRY